MYVRSSGNSTEDNLLHPRKVKSPIVDRCGGKRIDSKFIQARKADTPILVAFSIYIEVRLSQPSKA